jgi:pimeloyl-ACP methyl ester carboxylesterase
MPVVASGVGPGSWDGRRPGALRAAVAAPGGSAVRKALVLVAVVFACARPAAAGADAIQHGTYTVRGIDLHYKLIGDGPPLLLLHYFGGCGEAWQPQFAALGRRYRLIVPDLPGHGRSTGRAGEFLHREAARDVLALLDHLGVDRVAAMGMSSGGMTLLHMATAQPHRLDAMVLVGATTHFPEQSRRLMRRVPAELTADERADWGRCSSRGPAQTDELMRQFHEMQGSYDDMTFTEPSLARISARTLIVHGDRDEYFPVEIAVSMYRSIPRAALWIVPNGGHLPNLGGLAPVFLEEALAFVAGDRPSR